MFANAEGVSQRAPVNWSESVIGAAVCFPYVVALDESFITIHSMLDQQLKQTLSFRDGHILQDFEGISFAFLQVFKLCLLVKPSIYQIIRTSKHYLMLYHCFFWIGRASQYNQCHKTKNDLFFFYYFKRSF